MKSDFNKAIDVVKDKIKYYDQNHDEIVEINEVPFDKRPKGWMAITVWDTLEGLQFAFDQLEKSNKSYAIEEREDDKGRTTIRIFSSTPVGQWPNNYKSEKTG